MKKKETLAPKAHPKGRTEELKKGDIVLVQMVSGTPMGGKKLAEILEVYPLGPGVLSRLMGLRVYVFAWKQEVSTLAMHITKISDGEIAIRRLEGD